MSGALRLLLTLLVALALAGPATAHGEKHGEEVETPAAVAAPSAGSEPASMASRATTDHDRASSEAGGAAILKNLHPATVHFPIALLLVGALAELLAMARGSPVLGNAARVMAVAGGAAAFVAAAFGWIHTGIWLGGEGTMQAHRWVGTGLGIAGIVIAWLGWSDRHRPAMRAMLFAAAIAISVQGYLGGELSHGAGHLFRS